MAGAALSACALTAGESVVLTTGYSLRAERHEAAGEHVRLYSSGGVTELPATLIERIEVEEQAPPPTPPVALPAKPEPIATPPATDMAGEAARKVQLPEAFVRSVMRAESNFNPAAVSPKGAIGLMQLMPGTAEELGVDPHDAKQNAEGGARYLRELLERYQNEPDQVLRALAAYNAGPGAVEKYHGVPPFTETRQYVLRVLDGWMKAETKAEAKAEQAGRARQYPPKD